MEPKAALDNLYRAARSVSATADVHEALANCYKAILDVVAPPVKEEVPDEVST